MTVRVTRNVGMLLLALYLILAGLTGIAALGLPPVFMSVLALLTGILILVGR
jgi:hypothetical protein